ncbi:MAG: NYN domain-containing protein [Kofleriaceae bacterium]|nr:NYN domain-containing protein [Kofleriaceae bacterium]
MMFIDRTWFDRNHKRLGLRRKDPNDTRVFIEHIDFTRILEAVRNHIRQALGFDVDLVRAYCVAGHPDPDTVALQSRNSALRIVRGWNQVMRFPGVAVELYPYDYFGGQLYETDDSDELQSESTRRAPKEKCVDVALATKMLYLAALPAAYDIGVLVTGDRDFVPVLNAVRNLDKRTALAAILALDSCSRELKADGAATTLWDVPPLDLAPVLRAQFAQS